MDTIAALIRQKPRIFVYISCVYLLIVIVAKWLLHPSLDALWFFSGGLIGIYFLDAAELFFALNPSPFRSIVFGALFAVVTFFVVTSSTSAIGTGLVLSLFLQLLLWQVGEWNMAGNVNSWYAMVAGPVSLSAQRSVFAVSVALFLIVTYLGIR